MSKPSSVAANKGWVFKGPGGPGEGGATSRQKAEKRAWEIGEIDGLPAPADEGS